MLRLIHWLRVMMIASLTGGALIIVSAFLIFILKG